MMHIILNIAVGFIFLGLAACGGGDDAAGGPEDPPSEPAAAEEPQIVLTEAFPNLTFDNPVGLLQHPTDPQRWYVLERNGLIHTFAGADATQSEIVLNMANRVVAENEGGLLGMAFHPGFIENGQIYVNYTAAGNTNVPMITRISRFTSPDGGITIPIDSEEVLLSIPQPFTNHNGGWIGFDPYGDLFIALGDGGSAGDPQNNAQNPHTLLGSILRIDVDGFDSSRPYGIPAGNPFSASPDCDAGEGCPEVYAWGFRNPWRGSFDALTGDLWIGDVGQNAWEEIDRVKVGQNYGWPILEGTHCYEAASCDATGLTPPVTEYGHTDASRSVTGGYVYRGSAIGGLQGDYVYGDFLSGQIWKIRDAASGGDQAELLLDTDLRLVSFAQDAAGELYVIDFAGGRIYRLSPANGG